MAAISTNAIPATAAAPAKANGHDIKASDANKPGDDSFAALLNAANAQAPVQSAAPAAGNDKDGADTDKEDAPATADAATGTGASAKESAKEEAQPGKTPVSAKPEAKDIQASDIKPVNDNDPADALAQLATPPNDPTVMAQAQIASPQTAAQPQTPAANDDAGDHDEAGAIDAAQSGTKAGAKSGAKPAPAAPEDIAADNSKSPAAAAQAAVTGTNNGGSKYGNSGKDAETSDKAPVKAAEAARNAAQTEAPQTEAPQQQAQSAAPQAAPSFNAAAASSHTLPVQAASASHEIAAQVQVAPHTAAPDVNNLAVEIATRSQSGARQFSIRLDPPELGRVDVRLSIDATGKAEAHLTADHPDTLSLLQKDSSTLTQALRDSGLNVSQDGLNFSLRGQNSHAGHEQGNPGRRANLAATRAIDTAQNTSSITFTGAGNGRVDIHV